MSNPYDPQSIEYETLEEWEAALTLRVGTAYACRECGNLVMITKGGVGVLDLKCCGKPMEAVCGPQGPKE
jgi:hypothetical protein